MKIKAILFDLDGVLVDACEIHYQALNKALKEVSGIEISREDHIETFNGLPTKVKIEKLIKLGKLPFFVDKDKISDLKQKYTIEEINKLNPDLIKMRMLGWLIDNNIKTACVTNSINKTAALMLKNTGLLDYIYLLVGNDTSGLNRNKPFADPYLYAIRNLAVEEEECIIVEDSLPGVRSAFDTRCHVIKLSSFDKLNLPNIKKILINDFHENYI